MIPDDPLLKPYDPATDGDYFRWRDMTSFYLNRLERETRERRIRDRWWHIGLAALYVLTFSLYFLLMWLFP